MTYLVINSYVDWTTIEMADLVQTVSQSLETDGHADFFACIYDHSFRVRYQCSSRGVSRQSGQPIITLILGIIIHYVFRAVFFALPCSSIYCRSEQSCVSCRKLPLSFVERLVYFLFINFSVSLKYPQVPGGTLCLLVT